ncbi:MAG: tRNA glutamyl-Q(34) synthetase GluQRS [Proteobacteria bacterium]|nr:tRNA glutamyl-Q(34) synthetase GluQRS [Pseudomonadota bacterium]
MYRGRFAPSPTGPLHRGSLLAAVGSYLDARAAGGEWLVRIEDVDRGREVPGASEAILRTLEAFGLHWDGAVIYQHARGEAYGEMLGRLEAAGLAYRCSCSRSDFSGEPEGRYPGTCRAGPRRPGGPFAVRFRTDRLEATVSIDDRAQGRFHQDVAAEVGDFVLRRRDGFWSYQLAVVVDDAYQGITDVVRGLDLLDNTPRQRLLQAALGLPSPRTLHLPLVLDRSGGKLSKSRAALPADPSGAPEILTEILIALRQPLPKMLQLVPVREQLAWAEKNWNPLLIHGVKEILSTSA